MAKKKAGTTAKKAASAAKKTPAKKSVSKTLMAALSGGPHCPEDNTRLNANRTCPYPGCKYNNKPAP